jgi:hypothetical protein
MDEEVEGPERGDDRNFRPKVRTRHAECLAGAREFARSVREGDTG